MRPRRRSLGGRPGAGCRPRAPRRPVAPARCSETSAAERWASGRRGAGAEGIRPVDGAPPSRGGRWSAASRSVGRGGGRDARSRAGAARRIGVSRPGRIAQGRTAGALSTSQRSGRLAVRRRPPGHDGVARRGSTRRRGRRSPHLPRRRAGRRGHRRAVRASDDGARRGGVGRRIRASARSTGAPVGGADHPGVAPRRSTARSGLPGAVRRHSGPGSRRSPFFARDPSTAASPRVPASPRRIGLAGQFRRGPARRPGDLAGALPRRTSIRGRSEASRSRGGPAGAHRGSFVRPARHSRSVAHRGAERFAAPDRLQRSRGAGSFGAATGGVRPVGDAARRRGRCRADPAPAVAGFPARSGHAGSRELLEECLLRGAEGPPREIPEARLARGSAGGPAAPRRASPPGLTRGRYRRWGRYHRASGRPNCRVSSWGLELVDHRIPEFDRIQESSAPGKSPENPHDRPSDLRLARRIDVGDPVGVGKDGVPPHRAAPDVEPLAAQPHENVGAGLALGQAIEKGQVSGGLDREPRDQRRAGEEADQRCIALEIESAPGTDGERVLNPRSTVSAELGRGGRRPDDEGEASTPTAGAKPRRIRSMREVRAGSIGSPVRERGTEGVSTLRSGTGSRCRAERRAQPEEHEQDEADLEHPPHARRPSPGEGRPRCRPSVVQAGGGGSEGRERYRPRHPTEPNDDGGERPGRQQPQRESPGEPGDPARLDRTDQEIGRDEAGQGRSEGTERGQEPFRSATRRSEQLRHRGAGRQRRAAAGRAERARRTARVVNLDERPLPVGPLDRQKRTEAVAEAVASHAAATRHHGEDGHGEEQSPRFRRPTLQSGAPPRDEDQEQEHARRAGPGRRLCRDTRRRRRRLAPHGEGRQRTDVAPDGGVDQEDDG